MKLKCHSGSLWALMLSGDCVLHSREVRWVKDGLDDTSIDGEDGENDTGQEHKRQLVDIFHPHKNDHRHQHQAGCAINAHVI